MSGNIFIDAAYKSINHYGEELCGDKVEIVRMENGTFLAVLADGLGSGVKANILATLTSKIIATMLGSGAKLRDAVETIANTLPVCSERGIAYSTFTIVKIREDGSAKLAEFDNPSALLFKSGVHTDIPREEIVICGKKVYVSGFTVQSGDSLLCYSDGVVHAGVGMLLDLGWTEGNIIKYVKENIGGEKSPRAMTSKMLGAVNTLYMGKAGDDSTVLSLYVREKTPVTVMVGPPMNAELDKVVVNKLMYSRGLKVICGGTTSQIVSRVTGRELKVNLDYENPAIPPTASIYGIDLVTEGVLTIGKALDIIKGIDVSDPDQMESYSLKKKDGATLLARMLLEDATEVHFLVGRALNPAHQNPGMPVSLGLKLNLIKELSDELGKTGKRVTVEYF